jgi:hypothetical protein
MLKDTENARTEDEPAAAPEPESAGAACATCGAAMAPDQDWCLNCGQAAPGRLGGRPGMRAAATVAALTLALAGGAVAASYAALHDESKPPATAVASAPPAADVPPITTPPAATTPPATPPAAPDPGKAPKAPKVTPPAPTAAPAVPSPPTPPAATPAPKPKPKPKPAAPPAPTGPEPIDLGADAVNAYDPYARATAQGDPVDAYDGDRGTAWKITVPADSEQMAVGLVVDLGAKRSIDTVELLSGTPGFRVEVYVANASEVPPDVNDTRWAHVQDANVERKGDAESVALGTGKTKYRYVLLWFTKPPQEGKTVRISELTLLG